MNFLTVKEVAERLSISAGRVRQLIVDGRLPVKKFGNVNLILENDLQLVAERKAGRPKKAQGAPQNVEPSKPTKKAAADAVELRAKAASRWNNTGAKSAKAKRCGNGR